MHHIPFIVYTIGTGTEQQQDIRSSAANMSSLLLGPKVTSPALLFIMYIRNTSRDLSSDQHKLGPLQKYFIYPV